MKIICYLAFLTFFISCSKKDGTEKPENVCDRITEVLSYRPYDNPQYQTTATFTNDEQGRLKSVKGEGQNTSEYTYYNDRIELKAKDVFGNDISATYYLDNAKRIVRTKSYDNDFRYNAEGFLTSYRQPYGTNGQINGYTQYYLKYLDGNLQEVYTNDPNVSRKSVTFSYYDEPHQEMSGYNSPLYLSDVIYDRNTFFLIKGGFFGKQSKNLLKSVDHHQGYPVTNIEYTKDAKGRIVNTKEGYSFIYQCP
jgi:hypothetical protein